MKSDIIARERKLWRLDRSFHATTKSIPTIEASVSSSRIPKKLKPWFVDFFKRADWHPRGVAFLAQHYRRDEWLQLKRRTLPFE